MIAEVGGKPHLFDGVVDFMEFPEPWHAVEEAVNIPVDEVSNDKEGKELYPYCPAANLDGY